MIFSDVLYLVLFLDLQYAVVSKLTQKEVARLLRFNSYLSILQCVNAC